MQTPSVAFRTPPHNLNEIAFSSDKKSGGVHFAATPRPLLERHPLPDRMEGCAPACLAANKNLSDEGKAVLKEALGNLQACDRTTANCFVYGDLVEAHLLLGDYGRAQGYARHATLGSPADERAFFVAAESSLLQDSADSKEVARKYPEGYTGPVRLDEFKALRKHLGISDQKTAAHVA